MKEHYCTCRSGKLHTKYKPTEVDSDGVCLKCGHYAVSSIPEIFTEEKWNKSENFRIKRESEIGDYFLNGKS